MGGGIRLSSRAGEGFSARIDVPIESGLVTVLWVVAGKDEFALPAANVRRVRLAGTRGADAARIPHLLVVPRRRRRSGERASYVVDLELQGDDGPPSAPHRVGVDAVGRTEELLVRPLGPARGGPRSLLRAPSSEATARCASPSTPWAIAPRARAFSAARSEAAATLPSEPPLAASRVIADPSAVPVRIDR